VAHKPQTSGGAGVNERWQAEMAPYFAELNGRPPDQGFARIGEIFHLD
jgi:L-rhamnose mutarotase